MGRHIEETRGSGGSAAAASEAVGSNRSLALPQQARRKGHHQGDGVPSLKQQTALRPPAGWISRPAGRGKGREDEEERTRRGSGNGAAARHGTPTRGGSAGAAERTAEGPGNAGRLGEMVKRPAAWQERSGREEGGGKAGKGEAGGAGLREKEEEE
ncbi:unnamed protein product [Prorocentrum cordatum]|uniref:Uncharacterized protein n=1 Tax=Prorocentrum cordatum TaxID=2364126 RepID=A0ABN9RCU8_9DINO|nr:unnamed protein product [Polarella glacialis]